MDLVLWRWTWNTVEFDSEVTTSLVKCGMGCIRNNPTSISIVQTVDWRTVLHFRFRYLALNVSLLTRCQTGHEDRLGTAARSDSRTIWWAIEKC